MRVIFHTPLPLNSQSNSGSGVRPYKMRSALENLGHEVWEVSGYQKERLAAMSRVREAIRQGTKFDACYSELSTQATPMTEPHHLPIRPFMDFRFFRFLKKHAIPVGVFYRDIYWRFPDFASEIPWWQRKAAISMYLFELHQLRHCTNIVFIPSLNMAPYVRAQVNPNPRSIVNRLKYFGSGLNLVPLPPAHGCDSISDFPKDKLRLLYVGGLSSHYRMHEFFAAVHEAWKEDLPVELTFCCRENQWNEKRAEYEMYMCPAIEIRHASGAELQPLYDQSNVGTLMVSSMEYRNFAMPVKIFEYLGQGKPVLASANTLAGSWVKQNGCGWTVDYSREAILDWIRNLATDINQIDSVRQTTLEVRQKNSWEQRASQALNLLKN